MKYTGSLLLLTLCAASLMLSDAQARGFRGGMVPNAVDGCNTCHTTGGGTPRNAFGVAVEELVSPGAGGDEVFWGPELAALDSDGDGFTNGEELGDPDGTWQAGDDAPGVSEDLGHPGDSELVPNLPEPPEPTAVEESSWGTIKRLGRQLLD